MHSERKLNEFCGIAAVYLKKDLSHYPKGGAFYFLQKMLQQLQHRGQLSAGVSIYNPEKPALLQTHKGNGLVSEVFRMSDRDKAVNLSEKFEGIAGIGHTRYATSGTNNGEESQPFERVHTRRWKWFSFGFNGNVVNAQKIRKELEENSYHFQYKSDTEIMLHLLAHGLGSDYPTPMQTAFQHLPNKLDGAYNVSFLNAVGDLVLLRDPYGFKPLCYADTDDFFLAASENVALTPFVRNNIRFLNPGEMIHVRNDQKPEIHPFTVGKKKTSYCMFEWVYFASAGSELENRSVYKTRYKLGVELAKRETLNVNPRDFVVVNVPDTSKPAADGYAYAMKLPSKEGLLRNRYVGRTFIEGADWQDKVRDKFTINIDVLEGKKVILVEDSIVRGSTLKQLTKRLKEEGKALEVHGRISCPPIRSPCFYGIDMTTFEEFIASKHIEEWNDDGIQQEFSEQKIDKIGEELGLDSLKYQTREGLLQALKIPQEKLCMACLDGKYPTSCGKEMVKKAQEQYQKQQFGRSYEL
jgi:amidophosphoribosyltransferase